MTRVALAGGFAFLVSVVLTMVVKRFALRIGAVATPKADRWHRTRIPLLGGLAIAGAVVAGAAAVPIRDPGMLLLLAGALTLLVVGAIDDARPLKPQSKLVAQIVVAGALTLLVVGAIDDAKPLKPQSKLVAQIVVAAALAGLGLQLRLTGYPPLDIVLTLVWIVGITNAINLLDNMDGLATGVAALAAGFRLAFYIADGNAEGASFAAVIAGALLGFLVHNFNPASIFMGDAGSLFIGVIVSGLSLVGGWPYSRSLVSVLLFPVLLLLVPIFDTTFVTFARTLAGRPISMGGRDHTSHRLVALGLSERAAVLLLYLVTVAAGTIAFVSYRTGLSQMVVLIAFFAIGLALFGVFLGRLQVYPADQERRAAGAGVVRLISGFTYTHQIGTVCIDAVLVVLAYYTAYLLRFEGRLDPEMPAFVQSLPVVLVCQLAAFALFRVYQGMWRYTSVGDFIRLAQAATVGTIAAVVALLFLTRFAGYSRAVFVIDWLLLVTSVGAARLSFRALSESFRRSATNGGRRVLIYGAGDGGVMVVRELLNNHALGREAVAFLDDDRSKHRTRIQRLPVIGGLDALARAVHSTGATEVIVSSSKVPEASVTNLANLCGELGVTVVRASLKFE